MAASSRYDAVVFDVDGVLTEPGDPVTVERATRRTFQSFGVDPDPITAATMDSWSREAIEECCLTVGVAPEVFWPRREAAVARARLDEMRDGRATLYDDVEVLETLDGPLAAVSNGQDRTVGYVVELFGLRSLFADYRGRPPTLDGFDRQKPAPDLIATTLDTLHVPAHRALYVGDSNADLAAASALGMDAAFVRRPHRRGYELAHDPTYELDSLVALPTVVNEQRVVAD